MVTNYKGRVCLTAALLFVLFLSSCSRLGYGVLLWSAEDPPVPSGTVLPVYIRSNIEQVWVVGLPREYRAPGTVIDKFEIPLSNLELLRSRRRAEERAEQFAPFALVYAETLQDGLPIRERPENTARRVYRLRLGELVKILGPARGIAPISTTGEPLDGQWYEVLTSDGTLGYCFSFRLRLFEHQGGPLLAAYDEILDEEDDELEWILSRHWHAEQYGIMASTRRYDLDDLSQHWHFDLGQETGVARIRPRDLDRSFSYSRIRSAGSQTWRFEGTSLQMSLRSENTLAVQFTEESGMLRTLLFVTLSNSVDNIIVSEVTRREALFRSIYDHGPVYISNNYGTLVFQENGQFTWTGNTLLVPQIIPASALRSGVLDMRLYLAPALSDTYTGAFTLHFDAIGGQSAPVDFMYTLDSQGMRIEHVPQTSLDGVTVSRRASSPLVIFFFRTERPEDRPRTESILDEAPAHDFLLNPWD
ncbi:MAG: SH3 domain-containing protein [Treponema sp.]|nr:SH3 domain-containing protein [Treponema sp.]